MERKILKKYKNLLYFITISIILLLSAVSIGASSAYAFFENQARYAFKHIWLPMLIDESPEKRFQAMQAFLNYPDWGLPVLRNSIKSLETENLSWQIGMLIGMLGDQTDVPSLLKFLPKLEDKHHSTVWLGSMQRLYWKNRIPDGTPLKLKGMTINYFGGKLTVENKEKTVDLKFRIENPAYSPRFIRVSAHFWKTSNQENLPSKYFWLPAGGKIESKMHSKFSPVEHTNDVRLDFRIWEVGLNKVLLHETFKIKLNKNSISPKSN